MLCLSPAFMSQKRQCRAFARTLPLAHEKKTPWCQHLEIALYLSYHPCPYAGMDRLTEQLRGEALLPITLLLRRSCIYHSQELLAVLPLQFMVKLTVGNRHKENTELFVRTLRDFFLKDRKHITRSTALQLPKLFPLSVKKHILQPKLAMLPMLADEQEELTCALVEGWEAASQDDTGQEIPCAHRSGLVSVHVQILLHSTKWTQHFHSLPLKPRFP